MGLATTALSLLAFLCSEQFISCTDQTILQVDPHNLAVQVGENATLQCFHYPADPTADQHLDWFLPNYNIPIHKLRDNETVINETQSAILRYTSKNGTLSITDAQPEDARTFICKNTNNSLQVESIFKVYIMPSYFTEAMIVIGINAVLLVLFIVCFIWRTYNDLKERKQQTETRRRAKLGHREVAKKLMK